MEKFLSFFKKSSDDYEVFNWRDVLVFGICGSLVSGFVVIVLSLSHWAAYFLGYSVTFTIIMKMKHKEINEDVKSYLKFVNEKNKKKS
jgi:hypothetical protein